MKLTPYLNFPGNAEEALNFYADALGGKIAMITRFGEGPIPTDDDYKQKVMHGRLVFGDNIIMASDVFKGMEHSPGENITLSIEMDDVQLMEKVFNKLAEGGTITMPIADQFWGARFGMLKDRYKIHWMFSCALKK